MVINDFSAVIQLSATVCIAFVAVEYAKSYTRTLCERVFRFNEFIRCSFQECKALLTDKDTLDHIKPINLNGTSTNAAIEEAKRKNESLNKRIDTEKEAHINKVAVVCHAKSMPSVCFFLFVCDIIMLFDGGAECKFPDFTHVFASAFCAFSTVYTLLAWLFGERNKPIRYCNFPSLRNSIVWSFILFVISVFISVLVLSYDWGLLFYVEIFWWYILVVFVFITYANFMVYLMKIWGKAKGFKEEVNKSKETFMTECKEAEKDVSDLIGTNRLNEKLKAD